jgi:uncharacterized repeat protein (TIGR02543 family)
VESGDTITLPAKPTKTGYDFSGWFLDNNTFANVFGSSTAVNEDIIVYAKWIKVYEIGDTGPAGGIIFYKKTKASDGWQYLEVAPAEKKFSNIMWGAYDQDVTGTQTEMGTGKENTRLIVEYLGTSESGTAAQLCNDLTFGGYTDWFLPSADELDSIYWNPVSSTLWDAGILQYQLLSSSQYSTTDAYGVSGDATFSIDKDDDTQSAVAIRQF